jgi:hypothetical protein
MSTCLNICIIQYVERGVQYVVDIPESACPRSITWRVRMLALVEPEESHKLTFDFLLSLRLPSRSFLL